MTVISVFTVHIHVDVIVVSIHMVPEHTACLLTETTELLRIRQTWIPQHNLSFRPHASTSSLLARALTAQLRSHYHWQHCGCTPSPLPLVFIFEILEKKKHQVLWNIFGLSFNLRFRLRMCGKNIVQRCVSPGMAWLLTVGCGWWALVAQACESREQCLGRVWWPAWEEHVQESTDQATVGQALICFSESRIWGCQCTCPSQFRL